MAFFTFEFRSIVDSVLELTAPSAEEKGVGLYFVVHPEIPAVMMGDGEGLRSLLMHLITTAIASIPTGEVAVQARPNTPDHLDSSLHLRISFALNYAFANPAEREPAHAFGKTSDRGDAAQWSTRDPASDMAAIAQQAADLGGEFHVDSRDGRDAAYHLVLPFEKNTESPSPGTRPPDIFQDTRVMLFELDTHERLPIQAALTHWQCSHAFSTGQWEVMDNLADAHITGRPFHVMIVGSAVSHDCCHNLLRNVQENKGLAPITLVRLMPVGQAVPTGSGLQGLALPVRYSTLSTILRSIMTGGEPPVVETQAEAECPASAYEPGSIRILVAEDNMTNQKVAMYMLSRCGFQADAVSNGKEAVEAAERQAYDLVLMDIQMPVMDGYEATAEIRRMEVEGMDGSTSGKRLPIIAMTANAMKGDRQRCIERGMDDYIPKPVNLEELVEKIEKWVMPGGRIRSSSPVETVELAGPPLEDAGDQAAPMDYERALQRMMGDRSFLNDMLNTFVAQFSGDLTDLETAIGRCTAQEVQKRSHKIKGAALSISAGAVAEAAAQLEQLGRSDHLEEAMGVLSRLKDEFARLEAFIARITA